MTEKPKGAERYRLGTASYLSLVETVTQYLQYFFLYLNTYVGKKYFKCCKVAKPVYKIKAVVISWEKQTNLNAKLIFIIEMMGIYFLVFSLILHNLGAWFQSSCCSLLTVHLTQHSSCGCLSIAIVWSNYRIVHLSLLACFQFWYCALL